MSEEWRVTASAPAGAGADEKVPGRDGEAEAPAPPAAPPLTVGVKPWFPWPLHLVRWLNDPVPAERLAAVRIGLGLLLLLDILATYLPDATVWFGGDSMGSPELFSWVFDRSRGRGNWS